MQTPWTHAARSAVFPIQPVTASGVPSIARPATSASSPSPRRRASAQTASTLSPAVSSSRTHEEDQRRSGSARQPLARLGSRVQAAAETYFGTDAKSLTRGQAAFLAKRAPDL